jgi:hypothetical protein
MTTGYTIDSSASNSTTINGDGLFITTDTTFIIQGGEIITESFEFKQTDGGNFIEVIKREKPNPNFWVGYYPQKDRVFKEIYGITRGEGGKKVLQLLRTIEAEVIPGHYVEEKIEFPE